MGSIPEEVIERVRDAHDIVELVGRTVPLKKAGAAWKACCPLHDEDTPSFNVNPGLQIFKCFGCGKGGNVFHWLMESQSLTFPEAVRSLAEERGIEVPDSRGGAPRGPPKDHMRKLRDALDAAGLWFTRTLWSEEGEEARRYLNQRGYDDDAIKRFGLGYAPASWDGLLNAARRGGTDPKLMEEAGLAKSRDSGNGYYDTFRHRIMFPIRDWQGRMVTFAGRAMDPDDPAKYINGPETPMFKKSRVLYALDHAKKPISVRGEALLMEGYTDVLQCHLHGFDHAIAGMGTAFTDAQARLLRRFAERVVLLYDGDSAGRKAAERTLETMLAEGFDVRVATLPEGEDVDEILIEEGPEAVQAILDAAHSVLEFKLSTLARQFDLSSAHGRAKAAETLLPTLLKVRSPVEREQWIKQAAERLGGDHERNDVERVLRGEAGKLVGRSRASNSAKNPKKTLNLAGYGALSQARKEALLVAGILLESDLRDEVFRAVGPEEFTVPVFQRLYNALFDLYERGSRCDREALALRLAEDGDALAALAELPDGPTLADNVRYQIAFLERRRASQEKRDSVLAQLAAARDGASSSGPASTLESASESTRDSDRSSSTDNPNDVAVGSTDNPHKGPTADADPDAPPSDMSVPAEELDPWSPPVLDGPDGTQVFDGEDDGGWADDDSTTS